MPVTQTRRFGPLEYDPDWALLFPAGLPGFPSESRFVLVERPELAPLVCLQSLASPELCFLAAPVAAVQPDYAVALSAEDQQRLSPEGSGAPDLVTLVLLCAPQNGPLTANLLAPIVINLRARVAVQAIRSDARYSHRHPIGAAPRC